MAYENYCAACTYLSESCDYSGKYWCERKGEDKYANDAKCYSFCEAYSRSDSSRKNMYENSAYHSSSSCYITTIVCSILGQPDNNYYLNTLRKFRDNTMKTNPKYFPLLLTYDIIGPQIAANLIKDKQKKEIATVMFSNYITKSVDAINEKKEESAINIYKSMTEALAEKYNINMNIMNINPNEIDKTYLGHGKIRRLVPNER